MASIFRKPNFIKKSSKKTSKIVKKTPTTNGRPNNRFKAIAPPITSAISVAMIANSVIIQRKKPSFLLVCLRVACARSIWVTIPSLAAMYWSNIAIRLEIKMTDSRR